MLDSQPNLRFVPFGQTTPLVGIFRHVDAGYDLAKKCAAENDVSIPME